MTVFISNCAHVFLSLSLCSMNLSTSPYQPLSYLLLRSPYLLMGMCWLGIYVFACIAISLLLYRETVATTHGDHTVKIFEYETAELKQVRLCLHCLCFLLIVSFHLCFSW